jgi:hypothetical protein
MSFGETLAHLVRLEEERKVDLEESTGPIFCSLVLRFPEAKL